MPRNHDLMTTASDRRSQHNPPQHVPAPSVPFQKSDFVDDAGSTTKKVRLSSCKHKIVSRLWANTRHSMQAGSIYRVDEATFVKNEGDGNENLFVEDIFRED